jgi:hypothetical protein
MEPLREMSTPLVLSTSPSSAVTFAVAPLAHALDMDMYVLHMLPSSTAADEWHVTTHPTATLSRVDSALAAWATARITASPTVCRVCCSSLSHSRLSDLNVDAGYSTYSDTDTDTEVPPLVGDLGLVLTRCSAA